MGSPYEMFGTDADAEKDGVWVEYGDPAADGFAIKLARAGGKNKKFGKILEKKARPHRRKLQTGTGPEGLAERLLIETFAHTVVLDWKNIKDKDGNEFPFTPKNCIKLFTDLPDLFADVRDEADNINNFQKAELEEDEKNS